MIAGLWPAIDLSPGRQITATSRIPAWRRKWSARAPRRGSEEVCSASVLLAVRLRTACARVAAGAAASRPIIAAIHSGDPAEVAAEITATAVRFFGLS